MPIRAGRLASLTFPNREGGIIGELETEYIHGRSRPWIPFTPLAEGALLRYVRIDPVRGEILVSLRLAPGLRLAPCYHTGPVIAHTIQGSWRYLECDWVSNAGDTVFTTAGSMHTAESVGEQDALIFLAITGELLFFDESGELGWEESWKTSIERYTEYCEQQGLELQDLTRSAA